MLGLNYVVVKTCKSVHDLCVVQIIKIRLPSARRKCNMPLNGFGNVIATLGDDEIVVQRLHQRHRFFVPVLCKTRVDTSKSSVELFDMMMSHLLTPKDVIMMTRKPFILISIMHIERMRTIIRVDFRIDSRLAKQAFLRNRFLLFFFC